MANGEGNKFWQFNLGHLLTIITFVFVGVGGWFKMDARLTAVELLSTKTSALVETINVNGSIGTRDTANRNANRLDYLEQEMGNVTNKLERIDVNVSWILEKYKAK